MGLILALLLLVPLILLGPAAALAGTRLPAAHVYAVSAWDSVSFASGAAGLLAGGLIAAGIPTRRASRVDPLVALRSE
jgi:ABC-type antimicrobial peptide transport system permease subunit